MRCLPFSNTNSREELTFLRFIQAASPGLLGPLAALQQIDWMSGAEKRNLDVLTPHGRVAHEVGVQTVLHNYDGRSANCSEGVTSRMCYTRFLTGVPRMRRSRILRRDAEVQESSGGK